jgi:hypothetical protein
MGGPSRAIVSKLRKDIAKDFRYDPLPIEVRAVIVAARTRAGMLPKAAVDEMVPQEPPLV